MVTRITKAFFLYPGKTEQSLYLDHREMTCKHSMHSWNSGVDSYTPLSQVLGDKFDFIQNKNLSSKTHLSFTHTGNFLLNKIH